MPPEQPAHCPSFNSPAGISTRSGRLYSYRAKATDTGARFSRAPDLLLFRTQIGIVNQRTFPAEITIAYDLPIAANVTIELLDADDTPIDILISARRLPEPGAAFNIERFPYTGSIGPGYGYRIRAEVDGFEGEYLRPLRIVDDDFDAPGMAFLPIIRSAVTR